ncbi:phage tail sheath family protein [Microbulbifer rhizosphaerae]|uniref:Tail sheath protein C-terminal domain-containing protein n=1 Tax=Microbulbifer rhizosphaerae TaxID=1562603 RepID=A0A7W4ZC69_9GAMM|nr:phage tail sheath C-terminal domain-containing protein [Microbulbifer rhizosphaerae]MBB3063134.1 hypothetical protein [Microbulbifer rhizosphaerae]
MAFALTQGTVFGAPNLYRASDEERRTLGAERMDVCAFLGVAPRGPCRVPVEPEASSQDRAYVEVNRARRRSVAVAVQSWDDYRRQFGGFEGPGRLPYAVASFFEQGGRRAYIVRIVHEYGDAENLHAMARAEIPGLISSSGTVTLAAKNEGSWGNQLRAALGYQVRPLVLEPGSSTSELRIGADEHCPAGSLLRLTIPNGGGSPQYEFRFVVRRGERGLAQSTGRETLLLLNSAAGDVPLLAEVVEAKLVLEDGRGLREEFDHLGLAPEHPRWLANVLYRESGLVNPEEGWLDATLTPAETYGIPRDCYRVLVENPILFAGGFDRYEDIVHGDFFDPRWVRGNPQPGDGICALTHLRDLSLAVVPDLYVAEPLSEILPEEPVVSLAGAEFAPCVNLPLAPEPMQQVQHNLPGLLLDPKLPEDLEQIIDLQRALVDLAQTLRHFVVLLDVPPGISQSEIIAWRVHFSSDFSAAYYPWLKISNLDDGRDRLISINPAAVAAGIIARQELTFGVPHGPANALARSVVSVDEKISPQRHDQLHPLGINIFLPRRDGIWLSAARTLSRDADYRQLSVRRLMTMLQRVLRRQMQWVVFEPNNRRLWSRIRHLLNIFLRQLYIAGAFKGASEEQAFFVRCDGQLNNRRVLDAGQLIVEIGVAPAEPLEFIVLRIVHDGDGTLAVEA